MTAVASATDSALQLLSRSTTSGSNPSGSNASSKSTSKSGALESAPAVVLSLSDGAKALLEQLQAGLKTVQELPKTFDEMVQRKTDALAAKLTKAFTAEHIPLDEAMLLQVDSLGNVTTDSPYRKRIEQIFKDDPELAKEFKQVSSLNDLQAAEKALAMFYEQKKAATSKDEQDAAWDGYTALSSNLRKLSGKMEFKDGKLTSAGMELVNALSRNTSAQDDKGAAAPAKPSPVGGPDDPGTAILAKYGNLPLAETWAAQARADNVGLIRAGFGNADKWVDFARTLKSGHEVALTPGRVPSDDENFQNAVNLRVADQIVQFEDGGQTAKAQALRAAFNSGAINVQKSSDVPGLNLRTQITHFADAGAGGTMSSWDFKPSGDIKATLDAGDAIVIGGVDRGAFYLTW